MESETATGNVAYIVIITDEESQTTSIHSVYSTQEAADDTAQALESSLGSDMVVYVEAHEIFDN